MSALDRKRLSTTQLASLNRHLAAVLAGSSDVTDLYSDLYEGTPE